jgi:parallel beta-helix repeat protein
MPGVRLPAAAMRLLAIAVACLTVLTFIIVRASLDGSPSARTVGAYAISVPAHHPLLICGQPVLRSPFGYHGRSGRYRSGTAGLPTFGGRRTDFPSDTAGVVLPAGVHTYASFQLRAHTVYYLLPGTHIGSLMADRDDAFVGGSYHGRTSVLSGNYSSSQPWAIDSNSSAGDITGVTIEYLTIEKYEPAGNAAAVNPDSNTGWDIRDNLVTLNVPGAGVILGAGNTLSHNCLTLNGQYGFQSEDTNSWGEDALTGGPYGITVADNEISSNDTCDFSGLLDNPAIGWHNHNPVPRKLRNPHCGTVQPDGDQGGFKLWETNGVTVEGNYIHGNWGPGAWVDTDNANTTFIRNTITSNEGEAIIEEVSYNFSIRDNYLANNDWTDGLSNGGFPQPAIYVSESGSDSTFGGIPACAEKACAGQRSYPHQSVITDNTLINNGGSIFLWQNSNRFCSDGSDEVCTLVDHGPKGPFSISACKANLPSATVDTSDYVGNQTGTPLEDWWDGCMWHTSNVSVTRNTIDFDPAAILDCNHKDWPDCGAGGIFSEYGSPPDNVAGWVVPTQLTFFQHDTWADNTYNGPSTFYGWNQGNGDNPVSWANWTGAVSKGDKCQTSGERQSGYCTGPFGQDAGSRYRK